MIDPSNLSEHPAERGLSTRMLVALLAGATALGPFAIQIFVPALPFIQTGFGVPAATAALALSLSLWAIAVSNLLVGPLSDRYGRRPVILIGIAVAGFGSLVAAVAPSIEILIVGRIVQAAGAATGMVLGRAVVRDLFDLQTATSIIGKLTAVMVVAPMFAPLIGGVLLDLFDWRATFYASLIICMGMLLALWWLLAETNVSRHNGGGAEMLRQSTSLFQLPLFRLYFLQTAFMATLWFSFLASGPYLMSQVLGRSATEYGLWFVAISLVFMVSSFTAGRWSERFGVNRVILSAALLGLSGALVALFCALFLELSPLTIFLPCGIVLIGSGTSMPNIQAAAMSVDPNRAGAASGMSSFIQMASAGIVAQIVGSLQDDTLLPMAIMMVVGSILAVFTAVRIQTTAGKAIPDQPMPKADK